MNYIESVKHFRNNFESLWNKLKIKIARSNPIGGAYICNFIKNLDGNNRVLLLSGGGGGGLLFHSIMKQISRLTDLFLQPWARLISFVMKGYVNWRHHGQSTNDISLRSYCFVILSYIVFL